MSNLSDNEIIKALELCSGDVFCHKGNGCPYQGVDKCVKVSTHDAIDLINRQQAEIERLKDNLNAVLEEATETEVEYEKVYEQAYNDAMANLVDGGASCRLCMAVTEFKARKEFAEQLEAEIISSDKYIREYDDSEVQKAYNKGLRDALKILKEMGCERNE